VERYIARCLECAKHRLAVRSQPLQPILITYPWQLAGMDFIGPLDLTKARNRFIFNYVYYLTKFEVPFACPIANVEDVI